MRSRMLAVPMSAAFALNVLAACARVEESAPEPTYPVLSEPSDVSVETLQNASDAYRLALVNEILADQKITGAELTSFLVAYSDEGEQRDLAVAAAPYLKMAARDLVVDIPPGSSGDDIVDLYQYEAADEISLANGFLVMAQLIKEYPMHADLDLRLGRYGTYSDVFYNDPAEIYDQLSAVEPQEIDRVTFIKEWNALRDQLTAMYEDKIISRQESFDFLKASFEGSDETNANNPLYREMAEYLLNDVELPVDDENINFVINSSLVLADLTRPLVMRAGSAATVVPNVHQEYDPAIPGNVR